MKKILLADNDENFLKARSELLRQAGYTVLSASTPSDAERFLECSHLHLAILDIRLEDDSDETDRSGLDLALDQAYAKIPKIILTNFPDYTLVRESLAGSLTNHPPAIDFLGKGEGPNAIIAAVERAFQQDIKVNWNLRITAGESSPGFTQLCEFVSARIGESPTDEQSEELEEVFRRAFYQEDEIRIDRLLWKHRNRVALLVFCFAKESLPEGFVLICGQRDAIAEDIRRFSKYGPKDSGPGHTVLQRSAETVHFGGVCYGLSEASLDDISHLEHVYGTNEKSFNTALRTLLGKTLVFWHKQSRLVEEQKTLDALYRERLGLDDHVAIDNDQFRARVESLAGRLPMIGTRVEFGDGNVKLDIGGHMTSCPDPLSTFFSSFDFPRPVPVIITPGAILADTVFVDGSGSLWLTDFSCAGLAPVMWNHVAMEAAVRFDLVRSTNLRWLYEMETALTETEFLRIYAEDMEGPLKKGVKAIQIIRKDAANTVGADVAAYHLGLFFQAASRLAAYNPDLPMRDKELAPFAHLFIAMCVIARQLREKRKQMSSLAESTDAAIFIDKENRRVLVDGVPVSIRRNGYNLLCFLYDRADRLCDRKELVEAVFEETFDPMDDNQEGKLNTAIRRLREKIEDDPDDPKYLLTDSGGYRLVIEGKK